MPSRTRLPNFMYMPPVLLELLEDTWDRNTYEVVPSSEGTSPLISLVSYSKTQGSRSRSVAVGVTVVLERPPASQHHGRRHCKNFARFRRVFFLAIAKNHVRVCSCETKKKRPFRTPAKVEPLAPATWNLDHNRAIRSRTSVSNLMCVRWIVFELQMRFSSTGAWEYQVLLAFFMPKFYCFTKYSADFERLQKSTRLLQRLEIWTVTAQYGLVQTCQIWCACDE